MSGTVANARDRNIARDNGARRLSSRPQLESVTFSQAWGLDATGNWDRFSGFDNQSGSLAALDQTRTANPANEITGITALAGPAWVQPAYDRAGNMTSMPKPADPAAGFTAVYDAWNRLVRVIDTDTAAVIQLNQYDGLMRRTLSAEADGLTWETLTLDQWRLMTLEGWMTMELAPTLRHYYYSDSWQVLEERLGVEPSSADPDRQFLWGLRYIDDLIFRDRSIEGVLDERLYALQDANWNVIAVCDTTGEMRERYAYSPYGVPLFLNEGFILIEPNSSAFFWESLFCSYRCNIISGLYSVRFRVLQPFLGLWIQRDPIGAWESLYSYTRQNPFRYSDPLGLIEELDAIDKWEEASGIASAIKLGTVDPKAGWLAPAKGVAKPYIANNCRNIQKCSVTFDIKKAYKGKYQRGAGAGAAVDLGVYVQMQVALSPECGDCEKLGIIQIGRYRKKGGTFFQTTYEVNRGYADPKLTPMLWARAGWDQQLAANQGWFIDRDEEARNPYFTSGPSGKPGAY